MTPGNPAYYPTGWEEACFDDSVTHSPPPPYPVPGDPALQKALDLLQATHPGRYDNETTARLFKRMNRDRHIDDLGYDVRGLRTFVYQSNQIAAFYFVRLPRANNLDVEKAYCLTAGVKSTVTPVVLYSQLVSMCQWLYSKTPGLQLEIVNAERHLKHIAKDSAGAQLLADAFQKAASQTARPKISDLPDYESESKDPWFPPVKRWLLDVAP